MKALRRAAVALVAMEGVSYLAHRFVMHGPAMDVHADHHQPPTPGFERNDLFPLASSAIAIGAFALGTASPRHRRVLHSAYGITAYGFGYLVAHEIYIHRRLGSIERRIPYLDWLGDMHRIHHLYGGEPYGMLLPIVPRALRERAAATDRDPLRRTPVAPSAAAG